METIFRALEFTLRASSRDSYMNPRNSLQFGPVAQMIENKRHETTGGVRACSRISLELKSAILGRMKIGHFCNFMTSGGQIKSKWCIIRTSLGFALVSRSQILFSLWLGLIICEEISIYRTTDKLWSATEPRKLFLSDLIKILAWALMTDLKF